MKKLGDLMMILDLHRQGLKVAAIARQVGIDRKTARKYIARGLEPPSYGPRQPRPRAIDDHVAYLRARLELYPALTAQRLLREIAERGYTGGYSMVRDEVRMLRPAGGGKGFAVRFETLPGEQAQVDFAQFRVRFTAEPDVVHIVWLFSMVLGYSRLI
jgi:transposase